jgi:hypothetical protein
MEGVRQHKAMATGGSIAKRDPAIPLKGRAEAYAFARACGYGIFESTRRADADPETGMGSKWEGRREVQARIRWWRTFQQTDEILAEKRALIERELQIVGTANMDDFVKLVPSGDVMLPVLDLTRINALAPPERRAVMAAVKTIKYTENGPTFELHGKNEALAQLRDMHGFKAPAKTEIGGLNGGPVLHTIERVIVDAGSVLRCLSQPPSWGVPV